MSCSTCGSSSGHSPHPDQMPKESWCKCGFTQKVEVCSDCYSRYPIRYQDSEGVDILCPKCKGFWAYWDFTQM
jgi:hypothetical protein